MYITAASVIEVLEKLMELYNWWLKDTIVHGSVQEYSHWSFDRIDKKLRGGTSKQ